MSTSGGTSGGGSGLQPANNLSDVASIQTSRDNLAGAVTNRAFLRGDGTHVTLAAIQAADIPTLNQNTSGTAAGLSATLAIGSGGTNATTASAALANLGGAPLIAPQLTGVVNIGGPSNTFGTALCAVGSISNEGTSGFAYVYTAYSNTKAGIDLRSTGGTSMAALSHTVSGTVIGGVNFGGSTDTAISLDCAQIICVATQDFSATAAGSQLQFWTNPNNVANGKVLALTIDQDQTATFASSITCGAITASGAIVSTSTLSFVGNLVGTAFAAGEAWTGRRANGSSGSETQVLSGQQLGSFSFQGWNNTNGGYITGAQIAAVADETFTTLGFRGTRLTLSTALSATNAGAAVRLILDNAGKLWWGATTGAANAFVDQTGNASFSGTLLAGGNIGFNGKAAQATTGWAAPTATALRTAAPNATYSTTGGTGATAGAFDTAAHRDNIITDVANTMQRLGTLIADLRANGVIG